MGFVFDVGSHRYFQARGIRQVAIGKRRILLLPIAPCLWPIAVDYLQTASGFSFATGFPPWMCSSMMVATSASVTLEYQVASG